MKTERENSPSLKSVRDVEFIAGFYDLLEASMSSRP